MMNNSDVGNHTKGRFMLGRTSHQGAIPQTFTLLALARQSCKAYSTAQQGGEEAPTTQSCPQASPHFNGRRVVARLGTLASQPPSVSRTCDCTALWSIEADAQLALLALLQPLLVRITAALSFTWSFALAVHVPPLGNANVRASSRRRQPSRSVRQIFVETQARAGRHAWHWGRQAILS